jgi:hypothetical protein
MGVHGRGGSHGVAVAGRRCRSGDDIDELLEVDFARCMVLARLPDGGARTQASAVIAVGIEHRPPGEHDCRYVDGRRRHDAGRRGLVAARRQHHPVERIPVKYLDQAQISEVTIEESGRPLAGLLNGMDRKLEGHTAGGTNTLAHALGQLEVMAIARAQVGAGLGDADYRLAGCELGAREPVIDIALQVERGHARIIRVVEPQLRPQTGSLRAVRTVSLRHRRLRTFFQE